MEEMEVPPARDGSWEALLHHTFGGDRMILMDRVEHPREMVEPRGHRAIGVVYDPEAEKWGNYVSTVLPFRYDAVLHLDRTRALRPLHLEPRDDGEPPETFPSGM